jgi:hypothetical protein
VEAEAWIRHRRRQESVRRWFVRRLSRRHTLTVCGDGEGCRMKLWKGPLRTSVRGAEVRRARDLASSDGRLSVALALESASPIQILAAGPEH